MRTVQFGDVFPPIIDGVSVTTMNYAKWLDMKYGPCTVVVPRVRGYTDKTSYRVLRFPSVDSVVRRPYRVGVPELSHRFSREMRSLRCDLVHTHSPYVAGQQAYKLARRLNVPLVATFHSKFRVDFKDALKFDALANAAVNTAVRLFNKADFVWTVNRPSVETLRSYGYNGPIEIMPNGCDSWEIADPHAATDRLHAVYELSPGDDLFLFVGQQIWQKNIKLILDAARLYFRTHGGKLALVGEGKNTHEIRRFVKESETLRDRVIFTGKIMDRDEMLAFYLRAKAFLFPSLYDNAPLVVRETASVGCPSVLARGSHAAEDFEENREVFLCETTPESLSETMRIIVEDRPLYETVRTGCKSIAKPWEQVVDRVAARYEEIIEEWTARSESRRTRRR